MRYQILPKLWKYSTPGRVVVRCEECGKLLSRKALSGGSCKCGCRKMREARELTLRERFKIRFLGFKPTLASGDAGKRMDMPRQMGGVQ